MRLDTANVRRHSIAVGMSRRAHAAVTMPLGRTCSWPGGHEPPLAEPRLPSDVHGPPSTPPPPLATGALPLQVGRASPAVLFFSRRSKEEERPCLSVSLYDIWAQLCSGSRMLAQRSGKVGYQFGWT
jgi:hypothetical protein